MRGWKLGMEGKDVGWREMGNKGEGSEEGNGEERKSEWEGVREENGGSGEEKKREWEGGKEENPFTLKSA